MNWIVFTTECSGKTHFCRESRNKIGHYDLVEHDKHISVDARYENELHFTKLLLDLVNKDNQIYFTNIVPPNFILSSKDFFNNTKFVIILINRDRLVENVKQRHSEGYNTQYIFDSYDRLKEITEIKDNTIRVVDSFKSFSELFFPTIIRKNINIKQSIIRL